MGQAVSVQPLVAFSSSISHIPRVNLPNTITVSRLFLTAGFVAAVSFETFAGHATALLLFVLASISDYLDGYLARKLNLVTTLGKLLDPLADKILVCAGFVFLTAEGICPVWITALIIGREFLVTGLRQIAIEKGQVLAADRLGKWKTTFQLTYLITGLVWVTLATLSSVPPWLQFLQLLSKPWGPGAWLMPVSLCLAIGFTVISACSYIYASRGLLKS